MRATSGACVGSAMDIGRYLVACVCCRPCCVHHTRFPEKCRAYLCPDRRFQSAAYSLADCRFMFFFSVESLATAVLNAGNTAVVLLFAKHTICCPSKVGTDGPCLRFKKYASKRVFSCSAVHSTDEWQSPMTHLPSQTYRWRSEDIGRAFNRRGWRARPGLGLAIICVSFWRRFPASSVISPWTEASWPSRSGRLHTYGECSARWARALPEWERMRMGEANIPQLVRHISRRQP